MTQSERDDLRKLDPEIAGMSAEDLTLLVKRFPSMFRDHLKGVPTPAALNDEQEQAEEAAAQERYPNTKW